LDLDVRVSLRQVKSAPIISRMDRSLSPISLNLFPFTTSSSTSLGMGLSLA
jgi:hypothetical protein